MKDNVRLRSYERERCVATVLEVKKK